MCVCVCVCVCVYYYFAFQRECMNMGGGSLPVHNIVTFSLCVGKSMTCDRVTREKCGGVVVTAVGVTQE